MRSACRAGRAGRPGGQQDDGMGGWGACADSQPGRPLAGQSIHEWIAVAKVLIMLLFVPIEQLRVGCLHHCPKLECICICGVLTSYDLPM
jgi:hypothetical protein